MTPDRPTGAGQQQGRCQESPDGAWTSACTFTVGHPGSHRARDGRYWPNDNPAPSPTPPARDSGRDEAREAVARWLMSETLIADGATWTRRVADDAADELLALPELDKLLRRPA